MAGGAGGGVPLKADLRLTSGSELPRLAAISQLIKGLDRIQLAPRPDGWCFRVGARCRLNALGIPPGDQ